jgi:hypothetical protein
MMPMSVPPDPTTIGPFGGAAPSLPGAGPTVAVPDRRRPTAAGYWIAGLIIVVGAVAALIWFVSGISNLFSAVETYPRFTVPGQILTPLEARDYKIFAEYPGAMTDVGGVFRVGNVTVVDGDGRSVPVRSSFSEETYSWNGHQGRAIAEFSAPTAGNYTIAATSASTPSGTTVRVSIGRGLQPSALIPLFAAAGLGGIAVLVGIVLIVVTAVRRGRAKRRDQPATTFAYAYPGAHPPAGTAGQWGAPPAPGPTMPPPTWGAPPGPPPVAPGTPPIVPPGWGAAPGAPVGPDRADPPHRPDAPQA